MVLHDVQANGSRMPIEYPKVFSTTHLIIVYVIFSIQWDFF